MHINLSYGCGWEPNLQLVDPSLPSCSAYLLAVMEQLRESVKQRCERKPEIFPPTLPFPSSALLCARVSIFLAHCNIVGCPRLFV